MSTQCPKCGCPTQESITVYQQHKKQKNKKVIIALAIIIMILVVVIFIVNSVMNSANRDGYYNGMKWGISLEDVKNKLGDAGIPLENNSGIAEIIKNYDEKEGVEATVFYEFENEEKLSSINIYISNSDSSSYATDTLVNEYIEKLDDSYGEHIVDGVYQVWKTRESRIELCKFLDTVISIEYKDISFVESESLSSN